MSCPGCDSGHVFNTTPGDNPVWTFNGNFERPTFSPSMIVRWGKNNVCHFNITDGQIQFHGDSTHALSEKTVPMIPVPT